MTQATPYDAVIIGGGPSGATAALVLARNGKRVVIIEKNEFPRFHVGESFLPYGFDLIHELGLGDRLARLPKMPKFGGEFGFGHQLETTCFDFRNSLNGRGRETFNIERAPFDAMMLDAARDAGAEVRTNATVRRVLRLKEGDVAIDVDGEELTGRYVLDASGQGTLLAKHLGIRRPMENHRKVAYFGHFENVKRLEGDAEGHPMIAMCDEGWFWIIHIDAKRTSIGLVLDADITRTIDVPSGDMLRWGIERCPLMQDRTAAVVFPKETHTVADFSYYCRPYAGEGYFLVGDSAFFLDPIFSSGICLGMAGAVKAAELVQELIARQDGERLPTGRKPRSPATIRREYRRFIDNSAAPFIRFVNLFYRHSFRELFLTGQGPLQVPQAIVTLLAGYVFPKPAWSLRWRLWLFSLFVRLQRVFALTPHRASFSLCASPVTRPNPVEPVCATT